MARHHESVPDDPEAVDVAVRCVLDRLRHRRDDIADALDGRSLRVALEIGYPGEPPMSYRITFTREGHVMTRSGREFHPHVELRGTPGQVVRLLLGDMSMLDAGFDGVVTLHVPSVQAADYGRLRALVAEELAVERVVATRGS